MRAVKFNRRHALWMSTGLFGAGTLIGCGKTLSVAASTPGTDDSSTTGSTACELIPSETAGPYPAHDDSAINCLRLSGINRSDIKASLNTGGYTGTETATGLPLTIKLNLVSVSSACRNSLAGYAVYLWHCDINGKYSMYSSGITNQTYLRGVQVSDASGLVTFQSIYPGCYDGRMTHVHFEIYPNLATAVDDANVVKTSQFTFPLATSQAVYNGVAGYSTSITNLSRTSFSTDNVFSDGITYQVATVTGNLSSGYIATLNIGL